MADLSPADTFAQHAAAVGLSPEAIAATVATVTGTPAPAPTGVSTNLSPNPGLSDSQMQMAASTLRQFYTGDRQELESYLKAAGVSDAPDTRTDAERGFDRSFGGASEAEYDLSNVFVGRDDIEDITSTDKQLRTGIAAMGFPALMGAGIAEAILDGSAAHAALPDDAAAHDLYEREQASLAEKLLGIPYKDILAVAAKATTRLPPAIQKAWLEAGVHLNAKVLVQAYRQGERLSARHG